MDQARRHEVARTAGAAYAATGRVAAVVLAGSMGRGTADAYSDIELDVYWSEPPTEDDRSRAVRGFGRMIRSWPYAPDEGEWAEDVHVDEPRADQQHGDVGDGVDVGVSGFTCAWTESCIEAMTSAGDADLLRQLRVAAIRDGVALFGAELVDGWRRRAARYPDQLARAVVADWLDPNRLGRWRQRRALAARGEVVDLRGCLPAVVEMILGALCAVNRTPIPHPSFKWTQHLVDGFRIAPAELGPRLVRVADGACLAASADLESLLLETMALVEEHVPDADLGDLRSALAGGRQPGL